MSPSTRSSSRVIIPAVCYRLLSSWKFPQLIEDLDSDNVNVFTPDFDGSDYSYQSLPTSPRRHSKRTGRNRRRSPIPLECSIPSLASSTDLFGLSVITAGDPTDVADLSEFAIPSVEPGDESRPPSPFRHQSPCAPIRLPRSSSSPRLLEPILSPQSFAPQDTSPDHNHNHNDNPDPVTSGSATALSSRVVIEVRVPPRPLKRPSSYTPPPIIVKRPRNGDVYIPGY